MSKTQLETMANEDASINSLNQRKPKPERPRKQKNEHTQNKEVPSKECHKCGYKDNNNKCYAKGKRCTKCQKLNHFTTVCHSKPDARKGVHLLDEEDSDDELFVGCITSINTVELSECYEELTVQNKAVKFQLDTSAKCNVLPYKVIEDLGIQCHVEKTQIKLKSYSGHQIPTRGVVTLPCEHKGNVHTVQFHVAEVEAPAVLSAQTCKEMGLLVRIHQLKDSQRQGQHCIPKCPTVANQNILNEYITDRPWAKIGSDLFEFNGAHYLLSVDYYSKWIEIAKLSNLNSNNVICHLKSQFAKYGIPDELIIDNGPQYSSLAFKEFSHNYGFVHTTSSPKYPQANGEADRAVQPLRAS